MKYYGVVYDVGLRFTPDALSVEPFDPDLVAHDMQVIANDLHANAVRIEGEDIDRLAFAARAAHAAGLAVFFNPWKMNVSTREATDYFREAGNAAEALRQEGIELVFVAGCELTIFGEGIYPGSSFAERGMWLGAQLAAAGQRDHPQDLPGSLRTTAAPLNAALGSFAEAIRSNFNGPVTYSAGAWEDVDWGMFDMVGVDYYRRGQAADEYVAGLDYFRRNDKPVVVMEVGCCTYEGAAARGDGGFMILQGTNPDGSGIWEGGVTPIRSEREQGDYLDEQLELLSRTDIAGVFVFCFSFPALRTGEGAKDLDMACFSLVKTFAHDDPRSRLLPPWEAKEAFHRVARVFESAR